MKLYYLKQIFRILSNFDERKCRKVYLFLVGMQGGAANE